MTQHIFQTACGGETNECHNGGTMIWDPTKTFSCLCKEGYKEELCEKGSNVKKTMCFNDKTSVIDVLIA